MRLLFDQNLSHRVCRMLADIFPEAAQVRKAGLDSESDNFIWEYARNGGFTIVTLDSDFADIAGLRGAPPKVIWLRCGNQPTETVARILRDHALLIAEFERDNESACLELY